MDRHFLGRNRSLGASRLLFEIGLGGIEIRQLRDRLNLDSGYVSRLIGTLKKQGLIGSSRSPDDGRVSRLALTKAGREELALLNQLSDNAAAGLLERLNCAQRDELIQAMETVERLLRAGCVTFHIEDPGSELAAQCLQHYFDELSSLFEAEFEPSKSISATVEELTPPAGYFVVAKLYGDVVGCGALKCSTSFAEIKRMWVAPQSRGLGIGKCLLEELEELALDRELRLLRLETNKALLAARSLYVKSGYREVKAFNSEPYAHHWFEKELN